MSVHVAVSKHIIKKCLRQLFTGMISERVCYLVVIITVYIFQFSFSN